VLAHRTQLIADCGFLLSIPVERLSQLQESIR
jgi:hypothetical protein